MKNTSVFVHYLCRKFGFNGIRFVGRAKLSSIIRGPLLVSGTNPLKSRDGSVGPCFKDFLIESLPIVNVGRFLAFSFGMNVIGGGRRLLFWNY